MTAAAQRETVGAATFPTAPIRSLLSQRASELNLSLPDLADILRLPLRTLSRLIAKDRIRWDTADRVAIALGHHPGDIWPTWYPDVTTAATPTGRKGPQ